MGCLDFRLFTGGSFADGQVEVIKVIRCVLVHGSLHCSQPDLACQHFSNMTLCDFLKLRFAQTGEGNAANGRGHGRQRPAPLGF
jgi:hypothetical protein